MAMDLDKKSPEWIIGVKVKLKLVTDDELEGEIFTYDNTTNCVILTHIL
jgi:hypothetical protein